MVIASRTEPRTTCGLVEQTSAPPPRRHLGATDPIKDQHVNIAHFNMKNKNVSFDKKSRIPAEARGGEVEQPVLGGFV